MTRSVRVLRRAQRDLQAIYDLVVREAPQRADPFIDRLLDAIDSLATLSDRGAIPRDEALRQQGYRFLVHGPYLVFYKVLKRQVRVVRVLRVAGPTEACCEQLVRHAAAGRTHLLSGRW